MSEFDIVVRGGTIFDGSGGEPFIGDVAIKGDRIVAVGAVTGMGATEVDATGRIVTPGFVDIHTHYDGQATWSNNIDPSSRHGVTTVIMGNCGVGFAPCRPADRARLIEVMEGVEDIPEIVMKSGIPWNWESFPEYLDAVEAVPHDIDVGAMLPHSALRVYVMGERGAAREAATDGDLDSMAAIARESIEAGAVGFATSRTFFHRTPSGGFIPSFATAEKELTAIACALGDAGAGVMQMVYDVDREGDAESEFELLRRLVAASGRPLSFPVTQVGAHPTVWREMLELIDKANNDGLPIRAQVFTRPVGVTLSFSLSMNPFSECPAYKALKGLSHSARMDELCKPDIRATILGEANDQSGVPMFEAARHYQRMFPVLDPPDYEQPYENSVEARAKALDVDPAGLAYDMLLEQDGQAMLYVAIANYHDGSLEPSLHMLRGKHSVIGLGDGGAHYGLISDSSYTTHLLTHWTRDRTRGDRVPLPEAVRALTRDPAEAVDLLDRGRLEPGYKADLNIIDYDRLTLRAPFMVDDLPAGGRRLMQKAEGYDMTIVNGQITYRGGDPTGALPGRLVRGRQQAPRSLEAAA